MLIYFGKIEHILFCYRTLRIYFLHPFEDHIPDHSPLRSPSRLTELSYEIDCNQDIFYWQNGICWMLNVISWCLNNGSFYMFFYATYFHISSTVIIMKRCNHNKRLSHIACCQTLFTKMNNRLNCIKLKSQNYCIL